MKLNLKLRLLKVNKYFLSSKTLVSSCWFSFLDEKRVLSRKKRQTKGVIMPVQAVKAVIATAQLDQILNDKIMRKVEYTNSKIVNDYLDDFFILNLAKRLQPMFIPIDHTKFPGTNRKGGVSGDVEAYDGGTMQDALLHLPLRGFVGGG